MKEAELKIIRQAITSEIEGFEFYNMAGDNSEIDEVKDALRKMAQEEMKHVEWLSKLFTSIKSDDEDAFNLANVIDVHSPELFKWEKIDRKNAQMILSVFSIGIQMERSAVAYYRKAAEESEVPEACELYKKLVSWEEVHMYEFEEQYEKLKEEWWSKQEYAPF